MASTGLVVLDGPVVSKASPKLLQAKSYFSEFN